MLGSQVNYVNLHIYGWSIYHEYAFMVICNLFGRPKGSSLDYLPLNTIVIVWWLICAMSYYRVFGAKKSPCGGFSRGDLSPRQAKIRQTGGEKAKHEKCRTFVWRGERSPCENTKKWPCGGFSRGAFSHFRPENTIIRHGTNQPPNYWYIVLLLAKYGWEPDYKGSYSGLAVGVHVVLLSILTVPFSKNKYRVYNIIAVITHFWKLEVYTHIYLL